MGHTKTIAGTMRTPINHIIHFVPQQEAWVVERYGRFHKVLEPGLAVLTPFIDSVAYVQTLKEAALEIPEQTAITADNVTLQIDGVLYTRVVDPYKASYGVSNVTYAVSQMAQTTMRSEIGQLTLDQVFKVRPQLNHNISVAINEAGAEWGITCLRYEIRDVRPPADVLQSMHRMVSAERQKRAIILESEGEREAAINFARGKKESLMLDSEANADRLRRLAEGDKAKTLLEAQANAGRLIAEAEGNARKIVLEAEAEAQRINAVSAAIQQSQHGGDAVSYMVAEKYINAFADLGKSSNTMIVPSNTSDMSTLVASGLKIFEGTRAHTLAQVTQTQA